MTGLEHTMGAIPGGSTRRTYGTAYFDGAKWFANIAGSLLDARWLDPIQPLQGGKIVVDITDDGRGQSTALVIGGYTDQPRPSTAVVLGVGVAEIVLAGEDGVTYTTARFLGAIGGYAVADQVYITWDAAQPTVLGKVSTITVTPVVAPPVAPGGDRAGQVPVVATASDTFGVGGWGRWASSQNGGEDVYTGTQGAYTVTGSWFYGAPQPALAGKTVTAVRFRLPKRLAVGSYNADVTIHFYAHTSGSRPGGDVDRAVGPHDVSIPANFGGGFIDLPLSFAPTLAAGGGVSISGGPYAAFESRLDDPESGKLLMDWTS